MILLPLALLGRWTDKPDTVYITAKGSSLLSCQCTSRAEHGIDTSTPSDGRTDVSVHSWTLELGMAMAYGECGAVHSAALLYELRPSSPRGYVYSNRAQFKILKTLRSAATFNIRWQITDLATP